MTAKCVECGDTHLIQVGSETSTLVGYVSSNGHNHDDNCRIRQYRCSNGHINNYSVRQKCGRAGCDWRGKDSCFCHPGKKLEEWPQ